MLHVLESTVSVAIKFFQTIPYGQCNFFIKDPSSVKSCFVIKLNFIADPCCSLTYSRLEYESIVYVFVPLLLIIRFKLHGKICHTNPKQKFSGTV